MHKSSLPLFLTFTVSLFGDPLIIQPGLPGTVSKEINSEEAINIANTGFTKDDTVFMNHMIVHHEQALTLSRFAPNRTNTQEILDLAGRIDVSQEDEISFMQGWLEERNIEVDAHMSMHHMKMMGMASDQDIAKLSNSKGMEFDELFLRLMIAHHEGALDMVKELKRQPGSAYDPLMFEFVSDLSNDQGVEIERMNTLLTGLSKDPRASLKGGLYHAEEAILNLDLVQSLKKPAGFFDPSNPLNERLSNEDKEDEEEKPLAERSRNSRSPMLSFSNTDMAFSGNVMVAGSYHGFNIYNLDNQGHAELVSSVICPGGQGDVSIVGNLLIMSVEQNRGRIDCGLQGAGTEPNPERFRGIRIFDISDLKRPQQVGAVQTCRGSHTHSVVSGPDENGIIVVYNSGTSSVRDQEELESCFEAIPGDNRTALFRIDVIEIPIANPSQAQIVKSPTVFADPETGALAGLWRGGDHGDDTQDTSRTDECHDITVFPSKNLAAGACSGNGILFDISDPYNPRRLDVVTDVGFAYWHSATFNNAGDKIVFTDEWGGGGRPRCRAWDPIDWGANAIYDIVDKKLVFKSHYKMPAPQTETENCVAHNGSIIPIPERDIFVQAWYQGGLSVMDFTDSENPIEIGYFDRGPISEEQLISGGYWSTYYYEGKIYGTEIARGIDVFEMMPSQFITQKEIDMAAKAYPAVGDKRLFNPQQQFPLTWPK
ncbi:DUF305 domain-containing protein [Gammaproteobacteria bacterium]|nr:DUF305 domain-containing protein [Gammaproteobacteria bacterium]